MRRLLVSALFSRPTRRLLFSTLAILSACQPCPKPAPSPKTGGVSIAPEKPDAPGAPDTPAEAPDPDVLALAEAAAKKCDYEGGSFDWDCPEFREWRSSDQNSLFESIGANPALLSMLESDNLRMRALVVERGFSGGKVFFADKRNATRLLAVVDKEREPRLQNGYAKFVALIDGERSLGKELTAYAKNAPTDFRRALAEELLPQHPTAFSLGLVKVFLEDADTSVRRAALASLSSDGRTPPRDPICALLKSQMSRDDSLSETALKAGCSSKCPGMTGVVVSEIERRSSNAEFASDEGPDVAWALSSVCTRATTPGELKKRIFDVAGKVAPKTTGWRKRYWIELFRECDPPRAKAALTPYLTDKDADVANRAKEEIARLDEGGG